MRLVIGGSWQGKRAYVNRRYGPEDAGSGFACIDGLHNYIKEWMAACGPDEEPFSYVMDRVEEQIWRCPNIIVICDEVGGGIVPVEKEERAYRECVGRVLCELAREADSVERVYCGIAQTIKHTVHVALIRHGATADNLHRRYLGLTDAPLCETGIAALHRQKASGIYPPVGFSIPISRRRSCRSFGRRISGFLRAEIMRNFRRTGSCAAAIRHGWTAAAVCRFPGENLWLRAPSGVPGRFYASCRR